ncbi:hypothetical protein SAMN05444172_9185 [Burkholderia sp. GAS332]|nr:hypothetical protein SAMN05444172_9185 [Burkholderia sp. GAS332]
MVFDEFGKRDRPLLGCGHLRRVIERLLMAEPGSSTSNRLGRTQPASNFHSRPKHVEASGN